MINQLPDKLKNDITQYCKLNNIDDINSFIIKLIRQSLTIEMYGREPDIGLIKKNGPIVEEENFVVKNEEIEVESNIKKEYEINIDLKEKIEVTEQPTTQIDKNEDIYGEGLFGRFGGSNLYDMLKRKK